ncbi:MAG: hypothetical protein MHM6MM_005907 [Cercozoa sp. M6MM]
MGGRFSRLFRRKQPKLRILLLGLDSAGKTTILFQLKMGEPTHTVPTLGFNVETVTTQTASGKLTVNIWDVGGQDKLRPLWRHYYAGTSGVIFVVDSNDTERVELAKQEMHFLMQERELANACICVIANKQDLATALSPEELAQRLDLASIKHTNTIMPAVATEGTGLQDAMDWLAAELKKR